MNRSGLGSQTPADSTHSRTTLCFISKVAAPAEAFKTPQKVQFDFKAWKGSTAETAELLPVITINLQLFSFSVIFYLNDHE